ncbi:hypothetical protein KM043_003721 [Ampulex compressa]|nr:hypothetical protein KM043_003721 [Ampulex compressa]
MTSLTPAHAKAFNTSNKVRWRTPAVCQKTFANAASIPDDDHPRETQHRNVSRIKNPAAYENNDVNPSGNKISEESILDDTQTEDDSDVPRQLPTGLPRRKYNTETVLRRNPGYVNKDPRLDASEAMLAMQRLQQLKELQRRRDLTDRYYTQEIRRLIGERYLDPKPTVSTLKHEENPPSSMLPYSGIRSRNALEPCGTMTTIMRLDCGCVQETTRPIFTTTRGRVLRRTCDQAQDELKLSSSNPRERLFRSVEPGGRRSCIVKCKRRSSLDPRVGFGCDASPENTRERGKDEEKTGLSRLALRKKISDTSTTSL